MLFLTQVLPFPLDAGPKVRAYFVLRYLAQFHKITLVSFVRSTDTPEAIAHLGEICANVYTVPMPRSRWRDAAYLAQSLIQAQPFIIARDWAPSMSAMLKKAVAEAGPFTAIHADQLWMAPYALQTRELMANGQRPLTILDQHNAVYMIPQRLQDGEQNPFKRALLQVETEKLARYEADICRRFDRVVWVTAEDYQAVCDQAQGSPLPNSGVIPICVEPDGARIQRRARARRVTFLGGLHYPPNAEGICWFAEEVFPKVLKEVPDALLTIIGKNPPPKLQRLGLPATNLEVTGYVDDPKSYLEETAVFVVPLLAGGGMRVKILDAWSWGLPIVSTSIGAEGIHTRTGENILIANSPQEFAKATVSLLQQREYAQQLTEAAYQWVKQHYSWHTIYSMWDHVYAD